MAAFTKSALTENLRRSLDGGACINQRSLTGAMDLFNPEIAKQRHGSEIDLADLLEALWILDLVVVSNSISYDGTLPQKDIVELQRRLEPVAEHAGLRTGYFASIVPSDNLEQKNFAVASALMALRDLELLDGPRPGILGGLIPELDKPMDADKTGPFFEAIARLYAQAGDKQIGEPAASDADIDELLDARFTGSKCVAGLALVGAPALKAALDAPATLGRSRELLMASLINRFRFSYLRHLSYGAQDVYVPSRMWKRLSSQHAITFAEVVRKHFQTQLGGNLSREMAKELEAELGGSDRRFTLALPPIGLFVLMTSPDSAGPADVFKNAVDTFNTYGAAFRHFWSATREIDAPSEGWTAGVGDPHLDDASAMIEKGLTDRLGRLKAATSGRNASVLDRLMTPVFGTTIGAAISTTATLAGEIVSPLTGAIIGGMSGGVAGEILTRSTGLAQKRVRAHVDDYRELDADMFRAYATSINLAALGERVDRIFGRRLKIQNN
jgi:hypothetical protein